MPEVFEFFKHDLWQYSSGDTSVFSMCYHGFNLVEGAVWVSLGALTLRRFWRFRKAWLEVWYALTFVLFGLSDFVEAYALQPWLISAKLLILIALVTLRWQVLGRYYPECKTF